MNMSSACFRHFARNGAMLRRYVCGNLGSWRKMTPFALCKIALGGQLRNTSPLSLVP